ncbi:hypothetical protein ACFY0F_03525 [Streptomyces sp. NPDC001544]|uniref:hypothetical protein n=1 Tax=Streptomyces sp. NPDC001544 TaxID=3364584 RepID=UPI0036A4D89B
MARLPRRHILHLTGVSAVTAVVLALPTTTVASAPPSPGSSSEPSPGPATPGDSPPDQSPPATPPSPDDTPGSPNPDDTPGSPNPDDTPSPGSTPGDGESPTPPENDTPAPQAPKQQKEELDETTKDLEQKKAEVPGELAPSVEQLTATLHAVDAPGTPPQDRDAVIQSARSVSSALALISDPGTPPAVRARLTQLVQQVATTLDAADSPRIRPEMRRTYFYAAQMSANAYRMIGDPKTPPAEAHAANTIAKNLARSAQNEAKKGPSMEQSSQRTGQDAGPGPAVLQLATLLDAINDRHSSDDGDRRSLAQTASDASSSLDGSDDPGASDEEQEKARQELQKQLTQLEQGLAKYLSAQPLPSEKLGKAAEACTNAIFETTSEGTLAKDLESVLPGTWNTEGVNDFWKTEQKGNESLEVFTQLRNEQIADAPMAIKRLVPKLADSVPASQLFTAVGRSALHCLRAASQLDQDGIDSGTWVKMAEEQK